MDDSRGPVRSPEPSTIGGYPGCIRNMTSGKLSERHGRKMGQPWLAVEMEDEPQLH